LATTASAIQADRVYSARELARRHSCVVVLKGSGSVIAAPDGRVLINPTGNALLAGPGSGDVLAGWLGGQWAQMTGTDSALRAAAASTWLHGRAADLALQAQPGLRSIGAADLADAMRSAALTAEAA
jgi:NAD(P)H-hydrate repair Nnr-like enzyme with NAD(P)H-hydrate dehydratase domain